MRDYCIADATPNLSIITAYAPIEDVEEEVKEDFYESLQSSIEAVPKHDVLPVIGDFNAQVGNNNTGRERVMDRHSTGSMNNMEKGCVTCVNSMTW